MQRITGRGSRGQMPRGLGLLLLLLVVFSCTSGVSYQADTAVPSDALELAPSEVAEAQRRSLRQVYYRNNEAPPKPSARELRRLEHNLEQAPPVEVRELTGLFGNDLELLAYATRDSDDDGVLDYRVSEYRGKFFEGDIDVDNDGVHNVYDAAPYDPKVGGKDSDGDGVPDKPGTFADHDGDGIPDHLDWSRRKAEPLPGIQAGLFRDFGVILVERSARFTPELAQAIDDTLRLVFRERLPTLRTVAVEDQLLISPDLGDNGFMLAQTQTLTIYTKSIADAEPIVLFGLMVHEVGHAWQLAQDFDTGNLLAENEKMYFPPGRFTGSLARFGWKVDDDTLGEGYHHRLYTPHFYATSPRYLYRDYAPNEWAAWFDDVRAELGSDFLRNSPAVTWGMVGPYSLTSPWEWHADQLMASLYNRIDRGIAQHHNRTYANIASLLRARMLQSVQGQWSRYDYRNAVGTTIDREFARSFALSDEEVELLVDRYVIPLADLPMLSEALALESETVGVDRLGDALGETWDELRERVDEPLRRTPDLHALVRLGMGPWRVPEHDAGAGGDHIDEATVGLDEEEGDDAGAGEAESLDEDGDELLADADADADADPDLDPDPDPNKAGDELLAADEPTARSGLPRRHGAGRVGGFTRDQFQPDPLADGSGEIDESLDGPEGSDGGVRQAVDPVISLFEQLRRVVPASAPEVETTEPEVETTEPEVEPISEPS